MQACFHLRTNSEHVLAEAAPPKTPDLSSSVKGYRVDVPRGYSREVCAAVLASDTVDETINSMPRTVVILEV